MQDWVSVSSLLGVTDHISVHGDPPFGYYFPFVWRKIMSHIYWENCENQDFMVFSMSFLEFKMDLVVPTSVQHRWPHGLIYTLVAFDCNFRVRCVQAKFGVFSTLQTNTNRKWKRPIFNFRKGVAGALYYRAPRGAKPEQNVDAYLTS